MPLHSRLPILARKARSARFHLRTLLGRGALPNTIVIGAAKCGTTSLFEYLAQHPEVCASRGKELRFFDHHWERGPRWYRANFAPRPETRILVEASPSYVNGAGTVIARMKSLLRSPRLIVMLREPIARACSHYNHNRSSGIDTVSFEEAIRTEDRRPPIFCYRATSTYATLLEPWLASFPIESFIFIKSEDLFADPAAVFADLALRLGISPEAEIEFTPHNQRPHRIPDEALPLLGNAFAESNRRIKALTGIEWPSPASGGASGAL